MDNNNKLFEFIKRTHWLMDDYRRGERTTKEASEIMSKITEQAVCLDSLGENCQNFYYIIKEINCLFWEIERLDKKIKEEL
jgi:hypothetical protein